MVRELRPRLCVTTCRKPSAEVLQLCRTLACELHLPIRARGHLTLARIRAEDNVTGVLVVRPDGILYSTAEATLAFHPGMSKVRIVNLRSGRGDPMVAAMALKDGGRVLDCTLGLGTDAIVASWVVGESGKVVGVERFPPTFAATRHGLAHYPEKNSEVRDAMGRIETHLADSAEFLDSVGPGEFDVIYFDPFFETPVMESSGIAPLRKLAAGGDSSLSSAIEKAEGKAGKRVVIKGSLGSALWRRHSVGHLHSGRRSKFAYGVIETEGKVRF